MVLTYVSAISNICMFQSPLWFQHALLATTRHRWGVGGKPQGVVGGGGSWTFWGGPLPWALYFDPWAINFGVCHIINVWIPSTPLVALQCRTQKCTSTHFFLLLPSPCPGPARLGPVLICAHGPFGCSAHSGPGLVSAQGSDEGLFGPRGNLGPQRPSVPGARLGSGPLYGSLMSLYMALALFIS